jgi:tRNA(fMet)-specific endonuclease VapC
VTDVTANGAPGILDTSVVISLPDMTDPAYLPEDPQISVVTLAELEVGPRIATERKVREARARQLAVVREVFQPLPFDASVAHAFGSVAAHLRERGAKKRARSYDALIAATALANGMPLYTCNPKDFANIDGLNIVEVPEPTRLAS